MKIENATIHDARLQFEYDNRFLCLSLWLKTNHGIYSFGGICLGHRFQKEFNPTGGDHAFWWIKRVFDIADVVSFDELKDRPVRVEIDDKGFVKAIGHIVKDDWFYPEKDFKKESQQ